MTREDEGYATQRPRTRNVDVGFGPPDDQFVLDTHMRIPFMRRYFERRRAEKHARLMRPLWRE